MQMQWEANGKEILKHTQTHHRHPQQLQVSVIADIMVAGPNRPPDSAEDSSRRDGGAWTRLKRIIQRTVNFLLENWSMLTKTQTESKRSGTSLLERLRRGLLPPLPKLQQLTLNCSNNHILQNRTKQQKKKAKTVSHLFTILKKKLLQVF